MCLAIPVRVTQVITDPPSAAVTIAGVNQIISLALLDDDVTIGDYVLVHVGYALAKLSPVDAEETLTLMRDAGLITMTDLPQ